MILSVCDTIISLNTASIYVILGQAYRLKLSVGRVSYSRILLGIAIGLSSLLEYFQECAMNCIILNNYKL